MANSSSNGSSSNGSSTRRRSSSTSGRGRSSSSSSRGSSSRSRSSRSSSGISSIPGSINRSVILPVTRTVASSSWMPYALGAIGIGAIVYGLSRISAVRSLVSSGYDGVSDMLGGNDIASDLEDSFGFDEDVRVIGNDLNQLNRAM